MKVDILAIVAHPDDAELCCAGTLLHHQSLGYITAIVDLTQGELGSRGSRELRKKEAAASSKLLNLSARELLDLGDGMFENTASHRQEIIQQIRRFQPEIVLTNTLSDRHPDHGRAAKLVSDACFYSGLMKIETTWQNEAQTLWRPKQVWHTIQDHYQHPDIVIDITKYWEQKQKAILAFSSQFYSDSQENKEVKTPISGKDFFLFLEARAREMGRSIGVEFAEGFVKSRPFGVNDLFDLK